jgi:hypothetical protein
MKCASPYTLSPEEMEKIVQQTAELATYTQSISCDTDDELMTQLRLAEQEDLIIF